MKKIKSFISDMKSEIKKIRWPNANSIFKYSVITVVFVIFFAAFFYLTDLGVIAIRMLVK